MGQRVGRLVSTLGAVDARMVALAAAVEALSSGHARVLAAELRALLEDAQGAAGEIVSLAEERARGRERR